jgi:hypothetical protein
MEAGSRLIGSQRPPLIPLGFVLAATLVNLLNATIAGVLFIGS